MSRKQHLYDLLSTEFTPIVLHVDDESSQHQRPGIETHFKVTMVSPRFNTCERIARHRLINHCLHQEFKTGLHALSLHLYTEDEWAKRSAVPKTPPCYHHPIKS
ncbi:MAG: hypothetical protein A3F46_05095 [Legionellales bacterium RIFCSPHIGHO2_12_FULL_42_9]|nr:MAG: hypothetical protein A3F46_05095 [Legionellales bacterium RIFCSPHIGHO2_12_FULL_42_9]